VGGAIIVAMSTQVRTTARLRVSATQAWPVWLTCAQVAEVVGHLDESEVERRCAARATTARREADGSWRVPAPTVRELVPPSRRALWPKVDEQPSGRLADGTVYYRRLSEIARDPDEDKVQCHLGRW
jgi:hypothetical protein